MYFFNFIIKVTDFVFIHFINRFVLFLYFQTIMIDYWSFSFSCYIFIFFFLYLQFILNFYLFDHCIVIHFYLNIYYFIGCLTYLYCFIEFLFYIIQNFFILFYESIYIFYFFINFLLLFINAIKFRFTTFFTIIYICILIITTFNYWSLIFLILITVTIFAIITKNIFFWGYFCILFFFTIRFGFGFLLYILICFWFIFTS